MSPEKTRDQARVTPSANPNRKAVREENGFRK